MNSQQLENWADKLLMEYEKGRKELSSKKRKLNSANLMLIDGRKSHEIDLESKMQVDTNNQDKSKINSMIKDMSIAIDWMTTGSDPGKLRGVDKRAAYQRKSMADMDMFPSLDIFPEEKELNETEKEYVVNILADLSPRERQCFLLHKVYFRTFAEIGKELKIGRSTVQKYVERAKEKISCRADVVQCS
ncbi:sigma-70 family RNA polymerase sigma factor [Virgibacillus halophilus]|uniref:Sigma-70 family RNA polymerase sigma factor n=1 Tax=Tigheibacillus halophilus TaxID=361280 RepID=A0ABU5C9S6_9BACI|nr:sigma-70 family RNA polymerase sigma factor [Virgibacillus halophilus]